jgi:endonuclease III
MVSLSTVKTHVQRIIKKLSVSDRTQASVKAIEMGLLLATRTREYPSAAAEGCRGYERQTAASFGPHPASRTGEPITPPRRACRAAGWKARRSLPG